MIKVLSLYKVVYEENQINYYKICRVEGDIFQEIKSQLLEDEKTYLFFDEIQEIENWEKLVNSLASDYNVDIFKYDTDCILATILSENGVVF